MLVKICGITRLEDARAAVDAGAGAIGFILWPTSPRYIDPDRARAIAQELPASVTTVGVFVDQPFEHVLRVAERIGLAAIQLHGSETPEYASPFGDRVVIKALPVGGSEHRRWSTRFTILLDAHDPVKKGGTGTTIDWTAAAAVARERRILLAGGITPENVAQALAHVNPFGIDVSSGVEVSPGIKSPERIRALFEAVQAVHRGAGAPGENNETRS